MDGTVNGEPHCDLFLIGRIVNIMIYEFLRMYVDVSPIRHDLGIETQTVCAGMYRMFALLRNYFSQFLADFYV
jgi:hypothetical protein